MAPEVQRGIRAAITAIAHYVPPEVRSNEHLEAILETTDAWIRARTGIAERRISRVATSDLIVPAAQDCLDQRGISPATIDCVIVATITPDHPTPSTASIVQRKLGITPAWGFDLSAACSGFITGLVTARALVEAGSARRVLLCAADRMSAVTNPQDRSTAVLLGDAAGVALIEASTGLSDGIGDALLEAIPDTTAALQIPAGGSARPASAATVAAGEHFLRQDGPTVFKMAVQEMTRAAERVLARNGLTPQDLDWFVPHQANGRIIEAVARRVGVSDRQLMANVERYGNTSAATIPLCLSEWHQRGLLRNGHKLLLASFGAGFSAGAVYVEWGLPARVVEEKRDLAGVAGRLPEGGQSWQPADPSTAGISTSERPR